ncbi:DNA glycosylase, partial [Clohesyomyces aquaticus]
FGLIQERIRGSLFALVVQAVLWNRTTAIAGRPVLFQILTAYPTPEALAAASVDDLVSMIYTLGLHKRAHTLISLATIWLLSPPSPDRRYPLRKGTQSQPLLEPDDEGEGWEVAHLPGLGQYAMDSYRIFFRDRLRGHEGCEDKDFEPEWKNVVPRDKDLRAYLVWRWREEGWKWD